MSSMKIRVQDILDLSPCPERRDVFLAALPRTKKGSPVKVATYGQILASNGVDDLLWVVNRRPPSTWNARTQRLFVCDCAERVLSLFEAAFPEDDRPRKVIETARKFAIGEATKAELQAARAAAGDAAWDAAWDAVGAAAWDAARAAACEWQGTRLLAYLSGEAK